MCREERRITFSNLELLDALAFFCETSHQYFPYSNAADLTFSQAEELVTTVCEPAKGAQSSEFMESEIAVALILHCKHLGIPIARRAQKSLEVLNNNIVFVMKITEERASARDLPASAMSM